MGTQKLLHPKYPERCIIKGLFTFCLFITEEWCITLNLILLEKGGCSLLLLKLFQFLKELWILLLLCSWLSWLLRITASFMLSSVVHYESSLPNGTGIFFFKKTSWHKTTTEPAILFKKLPLYEVSTSFMNTTDQDTRGIYLRPRYRVPAVATNQSWFDARRPA